MKLLAFAAWWLPLLLAPAAAQNASETVSNLEGVFSANVKDTEFPSLSIRGELPQATPLPEGGIAAAIGPNQSHYYSLNLSRVHINISVSLCECGRSPLSEGPLQLRSGKFEGSTEDGGLLDVFNLTQFNDTLIVASPRTKNAQAKWSYQLGYDFSASYSSQHEGLYWVDSDFANSLFVTEIYNNFTRLLLDTPYQKFVNMSNLNDTTRQFRLFLHDTNSTSPASLNSSSYEARLGNLGPYSVLGKSFCAMQDTALLNQNNADFSTTDRNNNRSQQLFRGQFLFTGLNNSNSYQMQLAIPPPPGYTGGMVFSPVPFHTKRSTSCQLIYNMTTCPDTAFSVPGNASTYSVQELTQFYDNYVGSYFTNFTQALHQVNCDASKEDRFSVFSTCDNCKEAYLDWLCTVGVPRCEDWDNTAPYLKERLPGNSRNQLINDIIRPGKYKEVLPCYWLCDNLATYCPMSMGLGCPAGSMLNESYGWQSDDGDVSCSYPGAVYKPDGAARYGPSWILLLLTTGTFSLLCML